MKERDAKMGVVHKNYPNLPRTLPKSQYFSMKLVYSLNRDKLRLISIGEKVRNLI